MPVKLAFDVRCSVSVFHAQATNLGLSHLASLGIFAESVLSLVELYFWH